MPQIFDSLTYRSQLHRLRQLARLVLSRYHLRDAQLALLQYEDNAVYRITARSGERFVLRISAAEGYRAAEQNSEAFWLTSLRQETGLRAPEPVPTVDGRLVVTMHMDGIPEPRHCVLFRWLPGQPAMPGISLTVMECIGAFTIWSRSISFFARQTPECRNGVRRASRRLCNVCRHTWTVTKMRGWGYDWYNVRNAINVRQ